MLEQLTSPRKNKIQLSDYPFQADIDVRIALGDCSVFDIKVLEEILFSPLKTSKKKMARSLDCAEPLLDPVLDKFQTLKLLTIDGDALTVDKERRKLFELQIERFAPDFRPGIEFIQGLLKQLPIHLLPVWYAIPRTSQTIFGAIIEKYLLTPQIFQRYLLDLHFPDPRTLPLLHSILNAPQQKISSSDLIAQHNLSRREFEEMMILLELHFVACIHYEQQDDHWCEFATPLYEWGEYIQFLEKTEAPPLPESEIVPRATGSFPFIEALAALLANPRKAAAPSTLPSLLPKALQLKWLEEGAAGYSTTETGKEWLSLSAENRAIALYRHPLNRLFSPLASPDRMILEAEKSIKRALHGKWILFDAFWQGVTVPFEEGSSVQLQKTGKHFRYVIPSYKEEHKTLLKSVVFERLFEAGMVDIGSWKGEDAFRVTPFGQTLFAD